MKKIALCYDFDGTLCSGYMQNQHLIPDCKIDVKKFWSGVTTMSKKNKIDPTLSYMLLLENKMHETNIAISKNNFEKYGKKLKLFSGVNDWFKRINKFGKKHKVIIEHYIISSGLSDMIKGCSFIKEINKVYACEYIYKNNRGIWPKLSVNYSNKVQYLYRIHKGTFDVNDQEGVNKKKYFGDYVHVPFENMIFFGDGETDVPTFNVLNQNNGKSICVYEEGNKKSLNIAKKLFSDGRVHHVVKNDYRDKSKIDRLIKNIIKSLSL
tara:strand:- start:106 stop:903 length:798 start_codon:yes stop_codon:yes gene_type:complete